MTQQTEKQQPPVKVIVERIDSFDGADLMDLCVATEDTMKDDAYSFTIGLNRTNCPPRDRLEAYWKGVVLVPERTLIVGRLDGGIASSIQLVKPAPSNQTSMFCGSVDHHFVAPWARGHGLAKQLLQVAEEEAKKEGLTVLRLSVRSNLESAVALYEHAGYKRWGELDKYEMVDGKMLSGYFYYKDL
jgi:ribosomal protein S18 acetylase RimI-like enzyme